MLVRYSVLEDMYVNGCRTQTDEDSPLRDPNIRDLLSFFFQTAGLDSLAQSLFCLASSSAELRQTFHGRSIG